MLNVNALKADFIVPRLKVQKLISIKEVNPISSQPKNMSIALSAMTSKDILKINQCSNNMNLSAWGSFLKYVKE